MGKSTGPRTKQGKARSSQNAAKHWINTGRILPTEQKEAGLLRRGLVEDFKPQGMLENEVIDDLVLNRLIKRRIDQAFTREFSKASAVKPLIFLEKHEAGGSVSWLRSEFRGKNRRDRGVRSRPDICITGLEVLRDSIKERGLEPSSDLPDLDRLYGSELTEAAAAVVSHLKELRVDRLMGLGDQEGLKDAILGGIEVEITRQKSREDVTTQLEAIESAAEIQEPDAAELDKLLRYRAANTGEFKGLLSSLERIRRLRENNS